MLFLFMPSKKHAQGMNAEEPDDQEDQAQPGRFKVAILPDGECQFPPAGSR